MGCRPVGAGLTDEEDQVGLGEDPVGAPAGVGPRNSDFQRMVVGQRGLGIQRRRAEDPALPSRVVPSEILAFGTRDIITECRLVRTRPGTRPRSRCAKSAGVAAERNFPSWANGSSVQERASTSTASSIRSRLSSLRRSKPIVLVVGGAPSSP